jgi:hypothetical protein
LFGVNTRIVYFAFLMAALIVCGLDPAWAQSSPVDLSATRVLVLSPKTAVRHQDTHSALLLSKDIYERDVSFGGRIRTSRQLRRGSRPNPWETAWLVWNYHENRFYYLALKTNGWEIGKRDPAYQGGQRFLKTEKTTQFAIRRWTDFKITQTQNQITVQLNGIEVASFQDTENPYLSGRVGIYTEDAEIELSHVIAPFEDDFSAEELRIVRKDGYALGNWYSPFLGHGFLAVR